MPFPAPLAPLTSPALVRGAVASLSAACRPPAPLPLTSVLNSPPLQTCPAAAHTDNGPRLMQIGHVANLRGQWEARCGATSAPVKLQDRAPAPSLQTYQHVPLPPASVFALQPAVEGAPSTTAHPHLPTLPLLATMAEHRREHADTLQWSPLLLAGMPYSPRRNELHPHGIQARMLGSDMGAGEPPVVGHTPVVFAQRVAIHQFRQVLSACVQIGLRADPADSLRKAGGTCAESESREAGPGALMGPFPSGTPHMPVPALLPSVLTAPNSGLRSRDAENPTPQPLRLAGVSNTAPPLACPAEGAPVPAAAIANATTAMTHGPENPRGASVLAKLNPVVLPAQMLRVVHNPAPSRESLPVQAMPLEAMPVEAINPQWAHRLPDIRPQAVRMDADVAGYDDGGNEWEAWDDADYSPEEQQAFDDRFEQEERQMAALGQTPVNVLTNGNEWEDWDDAVYSAEDQRAFDERFEQEDRQMAALDSHGSSKPPIGPKPVFNDGAWRSTSPRTR